MTLFQRDIFPREHQKEGNSSLKYLSESKQKKGNYRPIFLDFGMQSDKDGLIENLSLLVPSGLTVLEALQVVKADMRSLRMQNTIEQIEEDIENGVSFSRALEQIDLFPSNVISLIRIGEETGTLSKNLNVIRLQQEKERLFSSRIQSAMLYPAFVLSLTVIIGVGIAWFILPKLAIVFSQLHIELPWPTKVLIASGTFLGTYGSIVVPIGLLLLFTLFYFIFFFSKTKYIGQAILFSIPGIRRLIQEIELSRFGYILGTLLEAGFPVTRAIETVTEMTSLQRYRKLYTHLSLSIEEGNSFQRSFMSYPNIDTFISRPARQIIITGEKSGNLSETFISLSRSYEARTETTTKNLTVILEPILLVVVWLGVLGVALGVILPIYSLIGGLNPGAPAIPPRESSTEAVPVIVTPEPEVLSEVSVVIPPAVIPEQRVASKLSVVSPDVGYLYVRDIPDSRGKIVGRVNTGEIYEYVDTSENWYQIVIPSKGEGWVSGQYITLVRETTNE